MNVIKHYQKGWRQKSEARIEFYATILNDLAEDVYISSRLTRQNLIEVIGYLSKENSNLINENQQLKDEIMIKPLLACLQKLK